METKVKILTLCLALLCALNLKAQVVDGSFGYFNDALRFSQTGMVGSARMQALGGAQVALGGDPSSAMVNPAGLGFFNRSTFTISPSFGFNNVNSNFYDQTTTDFKGNFNINNIGLVIEKTKGDISQDKFKGGSIGISLHRIIDFNRNFNYTGFNDENSIIDYFLQQSQGLTTTNIEGRGPLSLAYYNYLINPIPDQAGSFDSFVIGYPRQIETVETRGAQYQMNLSYGANYDDKLYFGAGLGIGTIRYSSTKIYREDAFEFLDQNTNEWIADDAITSLELEEKLRVDGIGINATLGLIYRPIDAIRFGVSYTSPSLYALNDESSSFLETRYNNYYYAQEDTLLRTLSSESDIVASRFSLSTPSRLSTGIAVFIGKNGFISADVEFVNYASAKISSQEFSVASDNATIANLYRNVINYRMGAEYRISPVRIRVGFNYLADPLSDNTSNRPITTFSTGVGYRVRDYYVDLAILNTRFNQVYTPYNLNDGSEPMIKIANNRTSAMITVGFNF